MLLKSDTIHLIKFMFPSCTVLYKILQQLSSLLRKVRKSRVKFKFSCWKASKILIKDKNWMNPQFPTSLDPDQRHTKSRTLNCVNCFLEHLTGQGMKRPQKSGNLWSLYVHYRRYQMASSRAKVGSPKISSSNRKSSNLWTEKFVRFADLSQMWHFAICRPNLFVICGLKTSASPQIQTIYPLKFSIYCNVLIQICT